MGKKRGISEYLFPMLHILLMTWSVQIASGNYLFLTQDAGQDLVDRGIWGGPVNISRQGDEWDLHSAGHMCAEYRDTRDVTTYRGIDIVSMSHDPRSEMILIQSPGKDRRHVTLSSGLLCSPASRHRPLSLHMLDVISTRGCAGPFSYFNSKVSFVLERILSSESLTTGVDTPISGENNETLIRLELRTMDGCEVEFPIKNRALDVVQCSRLVGVLADHNASDTCHYVAGNSLVTIPTAPGEAHFTQLFELSDTNKTNSVILVQVHAGSVIYLYKQNLQPHNFAYLKDITDIGGVSYKDNVLCWTTPQNLLCGNWNGYGVTEVISLVNVTEATSSGICAGSHDILTGVAITDAPPFGNLSVYFGCHGANTGSASGAGLIVLPTGGSRSIHKLKSGGKPASANGMLIVPKLSRACPTPTVTPPPTGGPGPGPNPTYNLAPALNTHLGIFYMVSFSFLIHAHT